MKIKITTIWLTIICLLSYNLIYTQDKKVVWVHGLNGEKDGSTPSIWAAKYAALFEQQRKMSGIVTNNDYTKIIGVVKYAQDISNWSQVDNTCLAVGHSMGGTALREIDVNKTNGRKFKGIITIGAPLKGVNIAHSAVTCVRFFSNLFLNFSRGWVAQITGQAGYNTFAKQLASLLIRNGTSLYFSSMAGALAGQLVGQSKVPYNQQTYTDLGKNSDYVNRFNNTYTSTPKIHIWGNEDNPVSWRQISSTAALSLGTSNEGVLNFINGYSYFCLGSSITNAALAVSSIWWSFGIGTAYFSWCAFEWGAAYDFFRADGRGNAQWVQDVVSACHYEPRSYTAQVIEWIVKCTYVPMLQHVGNKCARGWFSWFCWPVFEWRKMELCFPVPELQWKTFYYDALVLERSDGTVPEPSQKGEGQGWSSNATLIEAKGVNHSEYRDHSEMDIIWEKIWNGGRLGNPNEKDIFAIENR